MDIIAQHSTAYAVRSNDEKGTVAIFCRSFQEGGDPFSEDYYWQAYQDLLFGLRDKGLNAYFVTDNNSYLGDGIFETAYTSDHKTALGNLRKIHNVKVDMVFDRGGFIGRDVFTVNPSNLQRIGMNKIQMYKHFAEYQPFSIICNNEQEAKEAIARIDGEKVVVKEPEGYGGKQVYIGAKDEVISKLPSDYPLLVQEFLDTSSGVPGSVGGVHDIRLSVCGGEFIGYYIRQAKEGSLHSNVSQGGKMIFFDPSEIPAEVQKMAKAIDAYFANAPRYYAVDFIYTNKGWKMLELNPYLALLPLTDGEEAQTTTRKLIDYLAAVCPQHIYAN
jgi:glutathione synthase/RimK-type ligase-like ATP-grasp enzyme